MSVLSWPASLASEPSAATLSTAHAQGRLGHGLLMVAPFITVADEAARALAAGLLRAGLPHADYVQVSASGKLRQIRVEPMRELRSFLQRASLSGVKVAHISECEQLNDEAANLFLKILEEPPAGTYIILTTASPHAVLPTILSRTMRFRWSGAAQTSSEFDAFKKDFHALLVNGLVGATLADRELAKMAFLQKYFSLYQGPEIKIEKEKTEGAILEKSAKEEIESALEAQEAALKKQHRLAFLSHMESVVLSAYKENPRASLSLTQATAAIEQARRLMEYSFNEAASLELALTGVLKAFQD